MRLFFIFLLTLSAISFPARAEPAAGPAIKSIALIRVPEPREYLTMNKGSPAAAFGAIGGALAALESQQNEKGLLGALARTRFSFPEQLTQDLSAALSEKGYRVAVVKGERGDRPDKLLQDYAAVWAADAGAEAALDVSVANVGYSTEHFMFSSHWRPDVMVSASLVLRSTGERLYEERIMYGYHNPFMSGAKIDAPKAFQFADQDALNAADDTVLVGGLKDASKAIAAQVAKNLPGNDAKREAP